MDILAMEKVKRRQEEGKSTKNKRKSDKSLKDNTHKKAKVESDITQIKSSQADASLASLVKSVKAKTKSIQTKKVKLK